MLVLYLISPPAGAQNLSCSAIESPLGLAGHSMIQTVGKNYEAAAVSEMSVYLFDKCATKRVHKSNIGSTPTSSTYSVCRDGSYAFEQPDATGPLEWNGFCGETGMANMLSMTCGSLWHPTGTIHTISADLVPGTLPATVSKSLNYMAPDSDCGDKEWDYFDTADSGSEYISSIVNGLKEPSDFTRTKSNGTKLKRSPVMTMVKLKGEKVLHWITIVDIVGFDPKKSVYSNGSCFAYANQWGKQYKIPCGDLAEMAGNTEDVMMGMVGKYIRVKQVD
jgi:hypothetical protein